MSHNTHTTAGSGARLAPQPDCGPRRRRVRSLERLGRRHAGGHLVPPATTRQRTVTAFPKKPSMDLLAMPVAVTAS